MISPRMLIEGYHSPRVHAMKQLPFWMGGNAALDCYFSIDKPNYFQPQN